jgi:hypothetical protein
VPIPALDSSAPVSCTAVTDCGPALTTLQALNAVNALQPGGQLQPDNTVRGLSADVRTALQGQLSLDNFRCAPVRTECGALTGGGGTPPAGNVCQFVLRAKRINHYVDTAELVWFDEVDKALVNTVNSSLALFGAIEGLPQATTLCQPQATERRRRNVAHVTAEDI